MSQQKLSFFSPGVLIDDIPKEVKECLDLEISNIQSNNFKNSNSFNKNLAGHILKEYELVESKETLNRYLQFLSLEYEKQNVGFFNQYNFLTQEAHLVLDSLWVNFQKKYEFNPPHDHSGILSFVIWYKIPYHIDDEDAMFSSNKNQAGKFGFLFSDVLGKVRDLQLPVDRNWEGKIAVFPSDLMHYVNPFYTSDDYRITISGNLKLQVVT